MMESGGKILFSVLFVFLGALEVQTETPDVHLTVTKIGPRGFTISWDDLPKNFTKYDIVLTGDNINKAFVVSVEAGKRPARLIEDLQPGRPYEVTVHGKKDGAPDIELFSAIQYTAPLPPINVTYFQPNGTANIKVTWTAPEGGVNKYRIEFTLGGEKGQMVVNGTEFTFKNLKKGQPLVVLSVRSLVGTNPDASKLIESTPAPVRRNGMTDFDPTSMPGGMGNMLSSMSFLQLAVITSAVTGSIFFHGSYGV